MKIFDLAAFAALAVVPGMMCLACSSKELAAAPGIVDAGEAGAADTGPGEGDADQDAEQPA